MPTLSDLRPILADLGVGEPLTIVELAGGSNRVFRVDLASGNSVMLKTYDDVRAKLPTREAYASGLLAGVNVPVTRYLAIDESCARLPYRFAITNHLPGITIGSLRNEPDIADAYRQMGTALKKLHSVSMPGYGAFGELGMVAPRATNRAFIRDLATHAFGQFRHYGGNESLVRQFEVILEARGDLVASSTGPVFAHDDFHPNNVFAQRDADGHLQLTGIIDFGNAHATDAVHDLAKTLFICEHEAPGSSVPIREGYGPVDHPDPEAALWLYTLLHRVIMWWWLRHVGVIAYGEDHPLIADLRDMARSGGPALSRRL